MTVKEAQTTADAPEFSTDLGWTSSAPTMQLRWVPKSMLQATDLKLQQAWSITHFHKDGKPWRHALEWRDVPTEFNAR